MQAFRSTAKPATSLARSPALRQAGARRTYANPPNPAADQASAPPAPGRSNALVVASAIALFLGGLGTYNYYQTGRPQNLGKGIAKSSLPSQTDGGLKRMNAQNHELAMGGAEEEPESAATKPPTRRPASK